MIRSTARLLLRPLDSPDREQMARLYADPDVMHFISRGRPLGPAEVDEIIARSVRMWERLGFGPWAAIEKANGQWIGRIGLTELPWWPGPDKIEVGFELHREFWNQGFATEGARAALGFGFEDHRLDRIISAARSDHAASRRVMEKIGLAYQGVMHIRGSEVAWYALDRKDWLSRSDLGQS